MNEEAKITDPEIRETLEKIDEYRRMAEEAEKKLDDAIAYLEGQLAEAGEGDGFGSGPEDDADWIIIF